MKYAGELNQRVELIEDFRGYNHNLKISNQEFWDTKNVSTDYWPLLSTRDKRYRLMQCKSDNDPSNADVAMGILSHEKLAYCLNNYFYYNGGRRRCNYDPNWTAHDSDTSDPLYDPTHGTLPLQTGVERTLVGFGKSVCIFPDKIIYTPGTGYSRMETSLTATQDVRVTVTTSEYRWKDIKAGATYPWTPYDGTLWNDTSGDYPVLRRYSADAQEWISIPATMVTVWLDKDYDQITQEWGVNDSIILSGFENSALNGAFTLGWRRLYTANNYFNFPCVIEDMTGLSVVDNKIIAAPASGESIKFERKVPDMDFVVEWENRLWGCSSENNEIYSSALGDAKNWNSFAGLSTDSYAVSVGSTGPFTGAIVYNGNPYFFKQDRVYKIYGNYPSNFQLVMIPCRGVEEGSAKSLCNVFGQLYYKTPFDICAFNSGYPQSISHNLGHVKYKNGVFGALGKKLYCTMQDASDNYHTFVYDTEYGLWSKEDAFPVTHYAAYNDDLFAMADDPSTVLERVHLWSMSGSDKYLKSEASGKLEDNFEWYAESGDIELAVPDHEYVTKIQLRFDIPLGSALRVSVKYMDEDWAEVYSDSDVRKRIVYVPIKPKRTERMRIRIEGTGEAKVWSIAKTIEAGTEI